MLETLPRFAISASGTYWFIQNGAFLVLGRLVLGGGGDLTGGASLFALLLLGGVCGMETFLRRLSDKFGCRFLWVLRYF